MSDTALPSRERSFWERGLDSAAAYGPFVTLALGAAFAFAVPNETPPLLIAGLVALAAPWFLRAYPRRAPVRHAHMLLISLGYRDHAYVLHDHVPVYFI